MTAKEKLAYDAALSRIERYILATKKDGTLNLSGLGLACLPPEIGKLGSLRELALRNNKLTSLPSEIGRLTALEVLDLSNNMLTSVPVEIVRLKSLRTLALDSNRLTTLPQEMGKLLNLQSVSLSRNRYRVIPPELRTLVRLESLDLSHNQLKALSPDIGGLPLLSSLNLANNRIARLSAELGRLTALVEFDLSENNLSTLPREISNLAALKNLILFRNHLTRLPPEIGMLTSLRQLVLTSNPLRKLPPEMLSLKSLQELQLPRNKAIGLPLEILESHDAQRITDYYFRTNTPGESLPLNEFKLILVGRGGVGKTTLVEKLVTNRFARFEKTPGVKITQWPLRIGKDDVRAHVWDFGGQEIMHGTHRFFMTERALYLVLITGREGTEDYDAEYWLSLIRSFAGDVTVLVLLHKWSEQKFELNRELLREKYGKNVMFLETDSGETLAGEINISKLRSLICDQAAALPGLKTNWPKAWRDVKKKLPEEKRSWVSYPEFQKFCSLHGVPAPGDQEALASSLHELGLMLAYRKEDRLRGFGVLHPTWVTDGIYRMINDSRLQDRRGKFKPADMALVLPKREYPSKLHPYLLALMQKFRLCFPLDDDGKEYLIPELLSKREPNLDNDFPPDKSLCFTYHYNAVLPEGLLPRFIVETYVQRETRHAWKTGVVLERGNCRALVRGDLQARRISIRVVGPGGGRRELLGIIREHFERIHSDYATLPVTESVPIPKHPDVELNYNELLTFERNGIVRIDKAVGRTIVKLWVKDLLDGVDVSYSLRATRLLSADTERELNAKGRWLGKKLNRAPKMFISYSHADSRFLDQLRFALVPYERTAELAIWADPLVEAGQEWRNEIFANLDDADIFVLLLSPRSVASDFVINKELPLALDRWKMGQCEIMSVEIRPCGWKKLGLSEIQVVQYRGKAISQATNRDAAWQHVVTELEKVISRIKRKR